MIDLTMLEEEANRFLREHYGMKLRIPIIIVDELEKYYAEAAYIHQHKKGVAIAFAPSTIMFASEEAAIGALRHELVHYALHMSGKEYGDGSLTFENELVRLGVPSTMSSRVGLYFEYKCENCGTIDEAPQYFPNTTRDIGVVTVCCESDAFRTGTYRVYNGVECIHEDKRKGMA